MTLISGLEEKFHEEKGFAARAPSGTPPFFY
jgi:hypothetical protein